MKKSIICSLILITSGLNAQWNINTSSNTPVANAIKSQSNLHSVSDRVGGAIIVWDDNRNNPPNSSDVYAQRMDKYGIAKWTLNGKAICTFTGTQQSASIVDAEDGASIITWEDSRAGNFDIYAQKIDSSGNTLWTANGVAVCTRTTNQKNPKVISDKAGGAIIVWEDSLNFYWDVTAQRVSSLGVTMWPGNGVNICNAVNNQINPKLDIDGAGGAIITWQDKRNGLDYDIFAQKIDGSGAVQWTANGLAVCNALYAQTGPRIEPDGSSGAFIAWVDKRNGIDYDVYAQRINSAGASQWSANGLAICNATNNQSAVDIKYVGAAGLILAWKDARLGLEKIYVQLTSPDGINQMGLNGVAVSNSLRAINPNVVSDGLGGAIVAWEDSVSTEWNIASQKINSSGIVQWTFGGVTVSNATNNQLSVSQVSDGNGGAIYCWEDYRNGTDYDVYAQHLFDNGAPVIGIFENESSMALNVVCYPNPVSKNSVIKLLNCPEGINFNLTISDVFGKEIANKSINANNYFSFRNENIPPGNYFYRIKSNGNTIIQCGKIIILNE